MLNLPFLSLLSLSLALPSPQYPSYPPPVQTTTPGFSGNGTISVRSTTLVPLGCVDANFQFIDSSDPTQCAVFSASPTSEVVPVFDVTIYGVALNSSAGCCDVGATDNSPQATRCGEESVCGSEFATDNNLIQPLYTYNRVGGYVLCSVSDYFSVLLPFCLSPMP